MKALRFLPFIATLAFAPLVKAGQRGVINDPDGYVNLRAGNSAEAEVIAKVKTGEPFTFERKADAEWCKVTLASGKSGWMHLSASGFISPRRICRVLRSILPAPRRSIRSPALTGYFNFPQVFPSDP
jgi:uncharacterized protein YgiM (DUF1202 family)